MHVLDWSPLLQRRVRVRTAFRLRSLWQGPTWRRSCHGLVQSLIKRRLKVATIIDHFRLAETKAFLLEVAGRNTYACTLTRFVSRNALLPGLLGLKAGDSRFRAWPNWLIAHGWQEHAAINWDYLISTNEYWTRVLAWAPWNKHFLAVCGDRVQHPARPPWSGEAMAVIQCRGWWDEHLCWNILFYVRPANGRRSKRLSKPVSREHDLLTAGNDLIQPQMCVKQPYTKTSGEGGRVHITLHQRMRIYSYGSSSAARWNVPISWAASLHELCLTSWGLFQFILKEGNLSSYSTFCVVDRSVSKFSGVLGFLLFLGRRLVVAGSGLCSREVSRASIRATFWCKSFASWSLNEAWPSEAFTATMSVGLQSVI